MYIPGRRRTGSRPSRTVMSLASYVVLAIKKSLLVGDFYLGFSISDRTVGRAGLPGRERCCGSPRDGLPQGGIVDLRGDLLAGRSGRRRRLRHGPCGRLHILCTRLRQAAGREAEGSRRGRPQPLRETLPDRRLELGELEGPRARARGDMQGAVPGDARRPRVRRDRLADRLGPGLHHLADRPGGAEPCQLPPQLVAERLEPFHGAISTTLAVPSRRTSTTWAGEGPSAGTASGLVALTSVCPPGGRAASSARLRSPSSSLSTSSRR